MYNRRNSFEKKEKWNGMVSGICLGLQDPDNPTIILVYNADPKKPNGWGLPGGRVENGESPAQALLRKWTEEVETEKTFGKIIFRPELCLTETKTGFNNEPYEHFFLVFDDPGNPLKTFGVIGECGPPVRIKLRDVAAGKIPVYFSHLLAIYDVLKKLAVENKEMAFLTAKLSQMFEEEA